MIKSISELTMGTPETLKAINRLLPQLSASASSISLDRLSELVSSDNTLWFSFAPMSTVIFRYA